MRLRGFLQLLEAHGGGEVRVCDLARALATDGPEVRSALRAQGIVRDAARAESLPCDGLGCAREVRELPREEGGARRFFGVCTRDPSECETIEVGEWDLAQELVSREAFVAAVQHALRLTPMLGARHSLAGEIVPLGEEVADGEARDVFLAWRLDPRAVCAFAAERAGSTGASRPTRILTFDALSDLLTVRDGQIAEVPRLAVVPSRLPEGPSPARISSAPPAPLARSPALEGLRSISRWGEITLFDVDEDNLLGLTFDTRLRRLSCVDFGLATVDRRRPLDAFVLLKTICQGNGIFQTRAFGTSSNGKRLMSELRKALRATFGLEGDPFEVYSRFNHNWKPKFRALAAAPRELESAMKELGVKRPQSSS